MDDERLSITFDEARAAAIYVSLKSVIPIQKNALDSIDETMGKAETSERRTELQETYQATLYSMNEALKLCKILEYYLDR